MPVIMWNQTAREDELSEFDVCDMCRRGTSLLVICRLDQVLVSICGNCIKALQKGYDEMVRRRLQGDDLGELNYQP